MRSSLSLLALPLLVACEPQHAERAVDPTSAVVATNPVVPGAAVVLPRPELDGVRSAFLGFEVASAGSQQTLSGTGTLQPADVDLCPALEAEYGEPGRTLCNAGLLVLPTTTVERLPSVASGVAELWAHHDDADAAGLGLPMLLVDLEADELVAPMVGGFDGRAPVEADVVRRVQVTADGVHVWAKDPDNDVAAPLSGWVDRPAERLAVVVLPPSASALTPGEQASYAYQLSMRCRAEADCEFSNARS